MTALWWFAALGTGTSALRAQFTSVGKLRPMTLYVGSAQSHIGKRHLDSRPEAAREALADAIAQAQEALEELRALSRGIAPRLDAAAVEEFLDALDRVARGATVLDPQVVAQLLAVQRRHDPLKI